MLLLLRQYFLSFLRPLSLAHTRIYLPPFLSFTQLTLTLTHTCTKKHNSLTVK